VMLRNSRCGFTPVIVCNTALAIVVRGIAPVVAVTEWRTKQFR
jgi:hypothetical protein